MDDGFLHDDALTSPASRAEEVFLRHLAERARGDSSAADGIDGLCALHPDLEADLRSLDADMEALQRVRSRLASDRRALDPALRRLLQALDRGDSFRQRFELGASIGAGGQGEVVEARERALGRTVAVKTLRGDLIEKAEEQGLGVADQLVARFLAEAQITAQLDHPGVVALHELALDDAGRPYFTMARVRGRDLGAVYAEQRAGRVPLVRCLAILLRVAETMSFAHARGVVHRDLKPANVMVGTAGEVYVMDWGLARAPGGATETSEREPVVTVRAEEDAGSLLETLPSENLGTVFYVAPEVAQEGAACAGPGADVYALGAMLYELVAGRPPYANDSSGECHEDVLARIRAGPPEPLERHADAVPAELLSIAARALARDPAQRYADMRALESDLRAFLEDRVVTAHATGPLAELKKWISRNRRLAGALTATLAALLLGLAAVASVERRGRERLDVQADLYRLPYLESAAQELWPEVPATVPAYEEWLATADALVARLEVHRNELSNLRARALLVGDLELAEFRARSSLTPELHATELLLAQLEGKGGAARARIESLQERRALLLEERDGTRPWRFAASADQLRHDALARTVAELEAFADPRTGLRAEVQGRLEWSRDVEERTLVAHAEAWRAAAARVGASDSAYSGLELAPVLGLVPLGPDPVSGLEELAHARSGAVPERGADGALFVDGDSALVLVLVPGGRFAMGAQQDSPQEPGFDPGARPEEGPVHEVALEPFLIAKHELTQGQWERLGGGRPSSDAEPEDDEGNAHPVEGVSWTACTELLACFELELPTEAQWEYAARAGTDGPFLGHADPRGLADALNLADATVLAAGLGWPQAQGMEWLEDGYVRHAPVGSYAPNAFGLHDVLGNVWEWCRDDPGPYTAPWHSGSGLRVRETPSRERVARGGGYVNNAAFARVSIRDMGRSREFDSGYHGVRPVMELPR